MSHPKSLVIETQPTNRAHAQDMVNAVLGPGGSPPWSLLPAVQLGQPIPTAAIPLRESSSVLVRIHIDPDMDVADATLRMLRARADRFATSVGMTVTGMRVV